MEIEYLPISSLENAKPILEEFIEIWREVLSKKSLPGQFMRAEPIFADYRLLDNYTLQHTAVQYASALQQLFPSILLHFIEMKMTLVPLPSRSCPLLHVPYLSIIFFSL